MCCSPYDYAYPVFQGKYSRVDTEYGRVGSLFTDPNMVPGEPAKSNMDIPDEVDDSLEQMPPPLNDPNEIELTIPTSDTLYESGSQPSNEPNPSSKGWR